MQVRENAWLIENHRCPQKKCAGTTDEISEVYAKVADGRPSN